MSVLLRAALAGLALLALAGSADAKPRRPAPHHHHERACNPPSEPRDLMIRTVVGEAAGQPYAGQVAVAAVIRNRVLAGRYGPTVRAVVLAKAQFEPWGRRCAALIRLGPHAPGWSAAAQAVDEALAGADPTRGATHFANVATVRARRNRAGLRWIARLERPIQIGAHTFGTPEPSSAR